jgi:hypothetical protein
MQARCVDLSLPSPLIGLNGNKEKINALGLSLSYSDTLLLLNANNLNDLSIWQSIIEVRSQRGKDRDTLFIQDFCMARNFHSEALKFSQKGM